MRLPHRPIDIALPVLDISVKQANMPRTTASSWPSLPRSPPSPHKTSTNKRLEDYGVSIAASEGRTRDITIVALGPDAAAGFTVKEFCDWYGPEHVSTCSRCSGWRRSLRCEIIIQRCVAATEERRLLRLWKRVRNAGALRCSAPC